MLAIINNFLTTVFANQYFTTALTLFIVLYAGAIAPDLPPFLAQFFENPLFKLLILFLILLVRNYNPTVALISTIAFVLSIQALNRYRIFSMAEDIVSNGDEYDEEGKDNMIVSGYDNMGDRYMNYSQEGSCGACGSSEMSGGAVGGGCGCLFSKAPVSPEVPETEHEMMGEEEESYASPKSPTEGENEYDPYGFEGCEKPQPQAMDLVLPPQPDVPTDVAAVLSPNCNYLGAQGLQKPSGFPGVTIGQPF